MKQSNLDTMSIDGLWMLHERITATLAAKITSEKEALVDRAIVVCAGPMGCRSAPHRSRTMGRTRIWELALGRNAA
jgi:hypothetical protein